MTGRVRNNLKSLPGSVWHGWKSGSSNQKIFRAMVIIATATLGVKAISLVRDQYVAAVFGTSDALDAYLLAIVVPSAISSIIAGSFNAALIPTYVRTKQQDGEEAAHQLLSNVLFVSLALLGAATVVLAMATPRIYTMLAAGFNPDKLALAHRLGYVVVGIVPITGIITIWTAVLNADEQFAFPALSASVVPIATVSVLAFGYNTLGVYALAVGFVVGLVIQLAWLAWGMVNRNLPIRPRWHGGDPALRQVIGQYMPMVAGQLVFAMSPVIDQGMAGTLGSGSISALIYGNKLITLFVGIGTMALGTAVLPYFSHMVALEDWPGIRHTLKVYIRLILLVSVPLTVALIVFSHDIISLLFERGRFNHQDTATVSHIMAMFALQIPFYSIGILLVRLISSLKLNQLLLFGGVISMATNFLLDLILKKVMGAAGIALATSIVYVVALAFYAIVTSIALNRRLPRGAGDSFLVASCAKVLAPHDSETQ